MGLKICKISIFLCNFSWIVASFLLLDWKFTLIYKLEYKLTLQDFELFKEKILLGISEIFCTSLSLSVKLIIGKIRDNTECFTTFKACFLVKDMYQNPIEAFLGWEIPEKIVRNSKKNLCNYLKATKKRINLNI